MTERCPRCGGIVEGIKRGPEWLERALAVHELTCPSALRMKSAP